jgi:transglutaminase-like putative cysteine protease
MNDSIRYQITHRTHYKYASPVAICQNQLRMMPRPKLTRGAKLECHCVEVSIDPHPTFSHEHLDYFGNRVLSFSIEQLHRELTVNVCSDVTVSHKSLESNLQSPAWESVSRRLAAGEDANWLWVQEFLHDSPRIMRQPNFAEYARESFPTGREILEATSELTKRIHVDFKYDTTATHVQTSTGEAFRLRAGVCQDFAHIQIACLRSIGVPALYVSGYLRTEPPAGQPRKSGSDESHAWVSVYAGDEIGWVDYDPTNDCLTNNRHVPICIGRDYSDVSPMRGVAMGGGAATLSVSVDVLPVGSQSRLVADK